MSAQSDGRRCLRLVIHGRVQGVGYRAAFAAEAERLGLVGWVRNRRAGTVEAFVAGDARAVEAITTWARNGPPLARVEAVETFDANDEEARELAALAGFVVRATL